MVPSVWVFMTALPLNANGKVDRKALPRPDPVSSKREIVAAGTSTESEITAAWQQLLRDGDSDGAVGGGAEVDLGVTETFFDVGGNSLLLIRLAQLLTQQFQTNVTVPQLLRHNTIRQQAELVSGVDLLQDEAVLAGAAAAQNRRSKRSSRQRNRLSRPG